MNLEYYVNRWNDLVMELIGVAMIVPNCFYPWGFAHPALAAPAVDRTAETADKLPGPGPWFVEVDESETVDVAFDDIGREFAP